MIAKHSSDLAGLMCLEGGKPKAEAEGEINSARAFINFYAEMKSNGLVLPSQTSSRLLLATKEVTTPPVLADKIQGKNGTGGSGGRGSLL